MKLLSFLFACVLPIPQTAYAMETKEPQKLKLHAVCLFTNDLLLTQPNTTIIFLPDGPSSQISSHLSFFRMLRCRRVCKNWQKKIDEAYEQDLKMQEQALQKYLETDIHPATYEQFVRKQVNSASEVKTQDQSMKIALEEYKKRKCAKVSAVKHNLFVWVHNYLKTRKAQKGNAKEFSCKFTNPLWFAAHYNSVECFDLLLAVRTNVNRSNPLRIAIQQGHTEMAKKLITAGAVLHYENSTPETTYYETYNALAQAKKAKNKDLVNFIKEFQKNRCNENKKNKLTKNGLEVVLLPEN